MPIALRRAGPIAVLAALLLTAAPALAIGPGDILLVSSPGALGAAPSQLVNGAAYVPQLDQADTVAVSDDGRYSVFSSQSDGLSASDDNRYVNLFRKDRVTGAVVLLSQSTDGTPANGYSYGPTISDDGNLVAFTSAATNLAPGDTDGGHDVYVRNVSAGTTTLISGGGQDCDVPSSSGSADPACGAAAISGNGQYVAYATHASLAPADTASHLDVYRRDVSGLNPVLVSKREVAAAVGNGASEAPSIDDAGTHVAFTSDATDLPQPAIADTNGQSDVFVWTLGGDITLVSGLDASVSTALTGRSFAGLISGNGLHVAYATNANGVDSGATDTDGKYDTYRRDLAGSSCTACNWLIGRKDTVSGVKANGQWTVPAGISDDGLWIVFSSNATNLGGETDGTYNLYLRHFVATTIGATSVLSTGPLGPSNYSVSGTISGDASRALVVDDSALDGTPRAETEVYERAVTPLGLAEVVSRPPGSDVYRPSDVGASQNLIAHGAMPRSVSADGRYLVFVSTSPGLPDASADPDADEVYRRDLVTGAIELVSRATGPAGAVANEGGAGYASISADGSRVAFQSEADNLDPDHPKGFGVYVRDLSAQTTVAASRFDGPDGSLMDHADMPELSSDGRRVVWRSDDSGMDHLYVRDLPTGATIEVDRAGGAGGAEGNNAGYRASISGDGSRVAFTSAATNLDPDDTDSDSDVFVRDLAAQTTRLVSRASGATGAKATTGTYSVEISADGNRVVFPTQSQVLAPEAGAWNAGVDELVERDLTTLSTSLVSRAAGPADLEAEDYTVDQTGDRVVFTSRSTSLVPGAAGGEDGGPGVFVRDMNTGQTTALPAWQPVATGDYGGGASSPGLNADGSCLAFDAQGTGPVAGVSPDFPNRYVVALGAGACPVPALIGDPGPDADPVDPGPKTMPPPPPVAPAVTRLKVSNPRFAVGKAKTAVAAAAKKKKKAKARKPKTGTTFTFALSVKATVAITIEHQTVGRRKTARQCVKPTKKLAKKKKCALYTKVGTLTRASLAAGAGKVPFSGRIGAQALKPGAYRASVVAKAGGKSSAPATVAFTVVR